MSAARRLSLPLPSELQPLAQPLRAGRSCGEVVRRRLPRGVLSRLSATERGLQEAGLELTVRCLHEGLDVLWLHADELDDCCVRQLKGLSREGHPRAAQVHVYRARTLTALPELLIALLSAQGAPLILFMGPPSGVCSSTDARMTQVSVRLPRLCLMAGVTVLIMAELGAQSSVTQALARGVWSEVTLDR